MNKSLPLLPTRAIAPLLFVMLFFIFSGSSAQTGKSLHFNGTNNYVSLPFGISGSYTKEAWIKASSLTGTPNIITGNNTAFFIENSHLTAGHAGTYVYKEVQDTGVLELNTWYHIAVSYNAATSEMKLYKNGDSIAVNINASAYTENMLNLGMYAGSYFFNGDMDEERIWNTVRTTAQINQTLNCELTGDEPGLMAYYKFNQGIAGGNNTAITTATDSQDKCVALNGALNNFILTGTSSNFTTASPALSGSCSNNFPNINVTGNSQCIALGDATPSVTDFTDFENYITTPVTRTFTIQNTGTAVLTISSISFSGTNAADFSVTGAPSSTIAAGASSSFTVSFNPAGALGIKTATISINNDDEDEAVYSFGLSGIKSAPGQSLDFDGWDDKVSLPFVISGNYTKEAWIKLNAGSLTNSRNVLSGSGTALFIKEGQLSAGHAGTFNQAVYPTVLSANQWYHIAVSFNAATQVMKLYLNGNPVVTAADVPLYTETNMNIGCYNDILYYTGLIDQVRIWKTVRTDAEILNNYHCNITGNEPGLMAWYNFNHGAGEGNNAGITTLVNSANECNASAKNGTLNNFALTGSSSNFVSDADNITGTCSGTFANIRVEGNSNCILNGDNTPSATDNTNFGTASVSGVSKTFIIRNMGNAGLTIGSINFSGIYASTFSVTTAPAASVAPGASTNMVIHFAPAGSGLHSTTVTINNSDVGKAPFTFDISGIGAVGPINISNVTATPNINGTATITWTTDVAGSSVVNYGTQPSNLSLSKSNAALVTNHSLVLTGLSLGENYYFRVTSVDASANSVTEPAAPRLPLVVVMPPNITVQPLSQTICETRTAVFTSTALSDTTTTVQWQISYDNGVNWQDSAGATFATLSFVVNPNDNSKKVRANWTNAGGTSTSNVAGIIVKDTTWSIVDSTICSSNLPFFWNGYQFTEAGVYYPVIAEANVNGCDSIIKFTLTVNNTSLTGSIAGLSPACYADATGSITMAGAAGTGPFQYSIDNGATWENTGNFTDLPTGTYHCLIKDAAGCMKDSVMVLAIQKAVWTGAISSDWHTAGNWDTGAVPGANTHVIIPDDTPTCIVSATDAEVASVQVLTGAILRTQNNRTINIHGKCNQLPPP